MNEEQKALCEEYYNFAMNVAKKMKSQYRTLELDELQSLASEGMTEAIMKYDPNRKEGSASLKTFIYSMIRFKIMGEVRRRKLEKERFKTVSLQSELAMDDGDDLVLEDIVGTEDEGFMEMINKDLLDHIINKEDLERMGCNETDLNMFLMYYGDKKRTYANVARTFNIPETSCFIAIKKIKAKIDKQVERLIREGRL